MDIMLKLLLRDLCKLDKKDLIQKTLKTSEEVGELSEAVLSATKAPTCGYKNLTKEDILAEAADVIICAHSVALEAGFTMEDIEAAIKGKLERWQEKIQKDTTDVQSDGPQS